MKPIKKVNLIGLGAIGSMVAGKIHDTCPGSLQVVSDGERLDRYLKNDFMINNKTFRFNFVRPEDASEPADLVIIAVKNHHLLKSLEDIKGVVGPDTIIISLLNGISSEEIIADKFKSSKVLYSFYVGTDALRTGTSTAYSSIGRIVYGDKHNSGETPEVSAVKGFFDKTGIPCEIPEDILHEQWWKFMGNVGVNQVSAVLRAPYGAFIEVPEAKELLIAASSEVVEISCKAGINLTYLDIEEFVRVLGTLSPTSKTSMLQDIEAGRKTEVEIFAGAVIDLGKKYGVATPVNDILYKMIKALERMQRPE